MMDWAGLATGAIGAIALVVGAGITYRATMKGKQADHVHPVSVAQAYQSLVEDLRKHSDEQGRRVERLEAGQKAMEVSLQDAKAAEVACLSRVHTLNAEVVALKVQLRALGVPID